MIACFWLRLVDEFRTLNWVKIEEDFKLFTNNFTNSIIPLSNN